MRLLMKAEACRELEVSLSTLDRRIASGQVVVRREPQGLRHRVYVVMEDLPRSPEDGSTRADAADTPLTVARERICGLEKQVEFLREQLRLEQERNTGLLGDLKEMIHSSPAQERQRPWWRFWEQENRG